MNDTIKQMLSKYERHSLQQHEQALREILQEITLVGLWRSKFFEHAAFYGGTALRVFYGLDRFSEDLDFTLLKPNPTFSWHSFGEAIKQELAAFGFEVAFVEKSPKTQTAIKSAFLKTPTVQEMLKIGVSADQLKGLYDQTLIRIKVEIDTNPPTLFSCEQKFLSQPAPVSIKCVDERSLFVGKMQAGLYRVWKGRVKGRDWYDILWFIHRETPFDLSLFSLLNGYKDTLTPSEFLQLANDRIKQLDIKMAIADILPFIRDTEVITRTWSTEFFLHWVQRIQFC